MLRALLMIVLCTVLTALGVAGGWFAAQRGLAPPAAEEGEEPAGETTLSAQALRNLGVEVAAAKPGPFVRTIEVQAVLADRPENRRTVVAPLGGLITTIHVETGSVVAAGTPLVTIARDPIPRPTPVLTADLLLPVSEQVHEAAAALRSAKKHLDIAQREIARLRPHASGPDDLPVISRSRLVELEYERERAELELGNAHHELERHGLTLAEREAVAGGEPAPSNPRLWQRVLQENGLWTAVADRIQAALPEAVRDLPWAIAALGELTAAGLSSASLAALVESEPEAAARFSDIAGLLLQGTPVETVAVLVERGALAPAFVVRATGEDAADFDIDLVAVRAGQRVAAGDTLAVLHDPRRMWLQVEPVGREVGPVVDAVRRGAEGRLRPLVADASLANLTEKLVRLVRVRADGDRTVAFAEVANEPLREGAPGLFRSWRLRPGTRFLLALPAERFEQRFVLPIEAVTQEGAETIVYVRDGATFRPVPVHVEFSDHERVVIANDGALYPDDAVVVQGAYALGLALQRKAGGAAGHGHAHD
ncbi:MAG: hypothetical protein O2894_03475 [Planctomycetota bacterium]|nr:hypothetical protein [Planctomycetota bacterium]